MNRRFILAVTLVFTVSCVLLGTLLLYASQAPMSVEAAPTATLVPETPTPSPTPLPVLTVKGEFPTISAQIGYLFDTQSGNVLFDQHGEEPVQMASTTKIMTALIAIQTGNLDQEITVQKDAYLHVITEGSSNAGLAVGETFTLRELLYGLMLPSGGDAAYAIADTLAGSTDRFVVRMNLFALRLHLFQTRYTNVDGLTTEGGHYSSAADLVKLTNYAMQQPLFREIVQTKTYTLPATDKHNSHTWENTNKLLASYDGMLGVKTGHTDLAGYCLVFEAKRNGQTLLGVVLNSPDETTRDKSAATLLDWGFSLPLEIPAT
ncbi:D-alanyl-D-alanine carboxypeptidase family protein [Ktedonospora formicarum]|uniref:D-alanyl-D-alanine carboxypeptidase n=1 Tax=Ktedonospora formicarum TaxID=2778364 RepID=A0A8J3MS57_9CHLR|nr:D-alanyl-D-alanine carboxypeptidase family protein [Ktedonospora formicarum]GHO42995.1 D-alanyl-D-alanine carboxypeptidase [Ktedonospora formicarum]